MLEKIHIQNIGLVDDLTVEFDSRITMFSGETGAGKSMLLSSILLLMGGKISSATLRHGASSGSVFAEWRVDDFTELKKWLDNKGLESEEGLLYTKRVIKENGRSQCFISSASVTQKELTECMEFLCEVHTQHEQQALFKKTSQLQIIDRYAGILNQVEEYNARFSTLRKKEKIFKDNLADEVTRLREIDYLEFAIKEIEDARLKANEDTLLMEEIKRASNSEEISKVFSNLDLLIFDEGATSENMRKILSMLQNLETLNVGVSEYIERWNSILMEFDDLVACLSHEKDKCSFIDANELLSIENRFGLIEGLKKKYGGSIENILKFQQESIEKLDMLRSYDLNKNKLELEIEQDKKELEIIANKIHDIRVTESEKFSKEINSMLNNLAMQSAIFSVDIKTTDKLQMNGKNDVEFIMLSNKGERHLPLMNIASGGELSRVMFAIKVASTKKASLQSLVLDEVEAGIGGKTAVLLGEYIHSLGEHTQIIAVSHLPAIAAIANIHYKVEKLEIRNRTLIQLKKLNNQMKIDELARMISGNPNNKLSQEQAKQFIDHFNSNYNSLKIH